MNQLSSRNNQLKFKLEKIINHFRGIYGVYLIFMMLTLRNPFGARYQSLQHQCRGRCSTRKFLGGKAIARRAKCYIWSLMRILFGILWYRTYMASSAENKSFCEVPKYVINTRPHCPKLMKFTCYTHAQSWLKYCCNCIMTLQQLK